MDADGLKCLSRPQLQSYAIANGIRANQKSSMIIEQLMFLHPAGVPPPINYAFIRPQPLDDVNTSKGKNRASIPAVIPAHVHPRHAPLTLTNLQAHDAIIASREVVTRESRNLDVARRLGHHPPQPAQSTYTFGTPASSFEGMREDPAPVQHIKDTIAMIASVAQSDQQDAAKLVTLRAAATALKNTAANMRMKYRAQHSRRLRLEAYFAHWQKLPTHWEYSDIWEGYPMKVRDSNLVLREITSSDGTESIEAKRLQDVRNCPNPMPINDIEIGKDIAAHGEIPGHVQRSYHSSDDLELDDWFEKHPEYDIYQKRISEAMGRDQDSDDSKSLPGCTKAKNDQQLDAMTDEERRLSLIQHLMDTFNMSCKEALEVLIGGRTQMIHAFLRVGQERLPPVVTPIPLQNAGPPQVPAPVSAPFPAIVPVPATAAFHGDPATSVALVSEHWGTS